MKRRVLCTPTDSHIRRVFSDRTLRRLKRRFEVTFNTKGRDYITREVAENIRGYDGLITGWGSPQLTEDVFESADRLRIVAHSAGSVKYVLSKGLVDKYIIPRKICVCNAVQAIAYNVAEATVGLLIMASRRFVDHVEGTRERAMWRDPSIPLDVQTLNGSTIGVISASRVGREVIRLLKSFDTRILLHDPYVSRKEAKRLGTVKTGLEELFRRSDFVTVHAPLTHETVHMIQRRHLKLLRDGAVFVNTSRGKVIDQNALLEECRTGRITAVLDVTHPEPLPSDSPLRSLKNVLITPHITGAGIYGYHMIGEMTLQALRDFFEGRKVRNEVNLKEYDMLA